ncbi:hypothetical protein OIU76_016168 [Salix suchowensis]|nr:hypothetical protein OIU76_016168 [Salix suchowensis]
MNFAHKIEILWFQQNQLFLLLSWYLNFTLTKLQDRR